MDRANRSQLDVMDSIKNLHITMNDEEPTFEGGCEFLLRWYCETFTISDEFNLS